MKWENIDKLEKMKMRHTLWKLISSIKPRVLKAEARSEQILKRSAMESSGKEAGNDKDLSTRQSAWVQTEKSIAGVRS